jgi:hypothetical protein
VGKQFFRKCAMTKSPSWEVFTHCFLFAAALYLSFACSKFKHTSSFICCTRSAIFSIAKLKPLLFSFFSFFSLWPLGVAEPPLGQMGVAKPPLGQMGVVLATPKTGLKPPLQFFYLFKKKFLKRKKKYGSQISADVAYGDKCHIITSTLVQ